jgi:hypothetical protein
VNKTIQVIILTIVITIGIGARLSILGWLFIVGVGSTFIFGLTHYLIHTKYLDYFQTGGFWKTVRFILSHLFFIGIFLFQFDLDDSKTYSVIGNVVGSENQFLIDYGFYFVGLSLVGYILTNTLTVFQARKQKFESKNSKYIMTSLIGCLTLPMVLVYGIYSFKDLKEEKKREETGQFTTVRRALKNPDKVTSIDLSYSYPKHTKFPIEILDLPNLRQIDLNEQMIEIIPAEIVKAKRLEVLNLLDNNIKEIPQFICNCSNLKELRVGGHIKEFPECLKRMKSLTHLSIQSNTVNDLMDELRNFENLETAHFYLKDGILDREKLRQIEIETGIKHKY